MLKNTLKLLGLLILLMLSFMYTEKVFTLAKKTNPVMKKVISYKKKYDVKPVEPTITDDEIILGISGLEVNQNDSYKNMKNEVFNEEKIVYEKKLPKNSINNIYKYFIKKGNDKNKYASIILKINNNTNIKDIIKLIEKTNIKITFFVDGLWLENNVEYAFNITNLGCEIYNLGYDGKYDKSMITLTNRLLESITLKDSIYCLNETKNKEYKKICDNKKMYSVTPTIIEPNIKSLKENINEGMIISYDLNNTSSNDLTLIIKIITSKGYDIKSLSTVLSE